LIADFVNHFLPDLVFQDVAIVCCAEVEIEIRAAFDAHKCELKDDGQNA
jgi:hypothetical protein